MANLLVNLLLPLHVLDVQQKGWVVNVAGSQVRRFNCEIGELAGAAEDASRAL